MGTISTRQSALLDSELFDMLSKSALDVYFYVCDLTTERSRWSAAAVHEFDLKDEYQDGADWLWLCRIHPEDQTDFVRNLEISTVKELSEINSSVFHNASINACLVTMAP